MHLQPHDNTLGHVGLFGLVTATVSWVAQGALTAIPYACMVGGFLCALGQLWLNWSNRRQQLAKLKGRWFREWEMARDRALQPQRFVPGAPERLERS